MGWFCANTLHKIRKKEEKGGKKEGGKNKKPKGKQRGVTVARACAEKWEPRPKPGQAKGGKKKEG